MAKRRINSRNKGKKGELEVVHLFWNAGYIDAHRTQQFCGYAGDADVEIPQLNKLFVEVKWEQKLNLEEALQRAEEDCPDEVHPVVFHKKNFRSWRVSMPAWDFFELLKRAYPPKNRTDLGLLPRELEDVQQKLPPGRGRRP